MGLSEGKMKGGVILAGGNSTRFGRADKVLADLGNGRKLLQEVALRLGFLDELVIATSTEERASRYGRITGLDTVVDEHPGILGGILAGCRSLSSSPVLVVGGDMPLLRADVIVRQFSFIRGFEAVVPRHPNGYIEPLHVVLERVPTLEALDDLCGAGIRKVARLFECLRTRYLRVEVLADLDPLLECFTNVNDDETLRKVLRNTALPFPGAQNSRSSSSRSARAFTSSLERD